MVVVVAGCGAGVVVAVAELVGVAWGAAVKTAARGLLRKGGGGCTRW